MDQDRLGSYISEQILAERLCSGRMRNVLKSELLNDADRRDMESLVQDEMNHAAWLMEQAKKYSEPSEYPGTWDASIEEHNEQIRSLTPEQLIVVIYLPERVATKTIARQADIFEEEGDRDTASCYRQILGEEKRHVSVTGRILHNLIEAPGVREFYHEAIKNGYRQFHYEYLRTR